MKQLFKTTLLATAVAVTCGTAVAGTVSVTKQVHSTEGLVGVTANQTSGSIAYVVNAAYRDGDKITFTFSEGALVATSFPSQINVAAVNSATPASALAGMALGLLNSDTNSVTYRVTSVTQPNDGAGTDYSDRTTLGQTITLGAVSYTAASVAAAPVTITVSSQTVAGDVLDNSGTRTATVAESKTQFGALTIDTPFDAVIDVAQMRKAFNGATTDSMTYTVSSPSTTGWLNLATVNATSGTVLTVSGEAGKFTGLDATNFAAGGTDVVDEANATVTVTYGGQSTNDTIVFTPTTGDAADVLEAQKFTSALVYNYTSAGQTAGSKTIATGTASGEWVLNGASVNIPYMPYSANISQILYVSNSGTQAGDISVTAFDESGNVYELGVVKVANGNTVTKITGEVKDALAAAGFTAGKVSLTVTVNAPEDDITVYASYNVGGASRGFVNTDQYKGLD